MSKNVPKKAHLYRDIVLFYLVQQILEKDNIRTNNYLELKHTVEKYQFLPESDIGRSAEVTNIIISARGMIC